MIDMSTETAKIGEAAICPSVSAQHAASYLLHQVDLSLQEV
jgi:hypothetical protein